MNIIIFCAHDSVLCKFIGGNVCYLYGLVLSVFRSVALILLSVNVLLISNERYVIYLQHLLQFTVYLRAISIRVSIWFFRFCNNVPKFYSVISLIIIDLHLGLLWECCCVTGEFIHYYTLRIRM